MDQHQRQRIALFRFGVIAELVDCPLGAGEREARVRGIAERDWQVPFSGRQRVSRSTVLAWLARYEASGLASDNQDENRATIRMRKTGVATAGRMAREDLVLQVPLSTG